MQLTHSKIIDQGVALQWLLSEKCFWLWSNETQRETFQLLISFAPSLNEGQTKLLEDAILSGPPSKHQLYQKNVDHNIWLRLAIIDRSGGKFSNKAKNKLNELSKQNPEWQLTDDSHEFPFWMDDNLDFQDHKVSTPLRLKELINWLKNKPEHKIYSDWPERCHSDFRRTASALCALSQSDEWAVELWSEALYAWSEDKLQKRSWKWIAPVLNNAPLDFIKAIAHPLSWWLQSIAQVFDGNEALFLDLNQRILLEASVNTAEPSINHPVGLVTEGLIRWCFRQPLKDGEKLPEDIKPILTELCDTQTDKFIHARVLLAKNALVLYRVDPEWTKDYIIPSFDWNHSEREAKAVWQGFLSSARLDRPLTSAIKPSFLETANHYEQLGEFAKNYASLLTFTALNLSDLFTKTELAEATNKLPLEGLQNTIFDLVRTLRASRDHSLQHWQNRIRPYLKSIWPQSREIFTSEISANFAMLCIASEETFSEALIDLDKWLQPIENPDYIVNMLENTDLLEKFPELCLTFLSAIINKNSKLYSSSLSNCLDKIKNKQPTLEHDNRFKTLKLYLR